MSETNINKIVGSNLKCLRNKMGLDQEQFCKFLDKSQSQYSKIEKGKAPLTIQGLWQFAAKVGIDPMEFLKSRDIPFLPGCEPAVKFRRK